MASGILLATSSSQLHADCVAASYWLDTNCLPHCHAEKPRLVEEVFRYMRTPQ